LRLAAKAADRVKAAEKERPVFEQRLTELGYGPLAIAHAFSTLSGPGTVAEAVEALRASMRDSHPVALSFEVSETSGGSSATNGVTITSVERDRFAIRVTYDIVPPLDSGSHGPRGEAKDDLGNDYDDLGGAFGLASGGRTAGVRTAGVLTLPLPPPAATVLRIRIAWEPSVSSIWDGPAHEVRVSLPD
jgi:hypothetical protein